MGQESIRRADATAFRPKDAPSNIAAGLKITGKVASDGVIRVEGVVDGNIECAELTIGPGGRVDGQVTAASVHVLGRMTGTIHAKAVRIGSTARVTGEVIHESLTIEAGAYLDGYYRPVDKLPTIAAVDIRRHIGRATLRESKSPHRPAPPGRKRPGRAAVPPPPPKGRPKPLH